MSPRIRRFLRFAIASIGSLTLLLLIGLSITGWLGSSYLTSPPRKKADPAYDPIFQDPASHGIHISRRTADDGTPYLLVRSTLQPGVSARAAGILQAFQSSGIRLPDPVRPAGTVIVLHGHTSGKEDGLPIAIRLAAAGFDSILPDLPGHGQSPLAHSGFGALEGPLLESWFRHARPELHSPDLPPHLLGVSQGGSVSLLAASRNPSAFGAIISLSTFTSLDFAVGRSAQRQIPASLQSVLPAAIVSVRLATRLRAGYDPADVSPCLAALSIPNPTLIIHGDKDSYIPFDNAVEIHRNLRDGQLLRIPNGTHNAFLAGGTQLYLDMIRFLLDHNQQRP